MVHGSPKVTTMAHKFQAVLDEELLNERGHALGLLKRKRLVTPLRLGLSVIASLAAHHVQPIADLPRHFNAVWELGTDDNACYKQLDTSATPECFLDPLSHLMPHLTMNVLGCEAGTACSALGRLILHDGSSFALQKALADVVPGRFSAVSPAAVELHCTMDVLQDAPIVVSLRPDTDAEHASRPDPERLRGDLLFADRGALDLPSVRDIDRHGGFLLMRSKAGVHPRVIEASRDDGQRLTSCQDRHLQALPSQWPTQQRTALEVEWRIEGEPCRARLMVRWHPKDTCFHSLLTNLPQEK
jgi:hypothetical protein